MRYFNVAGPCNNVDHYMVDASTRLQGVEQLIDMRQYFVIHAARQSGKTTCLLDLTHRLNAQGKYHAAYCSLEGIQGITAAEKGIPLVVECIKQALHICNIPKSDLFAKNADYSNFAGVINVEFTKFCGLLEKPLVLFFDEADCLYGDTLMSFLRQLRLGYVSRTLAPFIHSMALVGMRNIRDFKVLIRSEKETLGSASPFNIVTEALTLSNFTKEEVALLYRQHTKDTGQIFENEAVDLIYNQTLGQPWLVNAIAREVVVKMLHSDYSKPVTPSLVHQAIQTIILRRDTHIDSLLERLKEERVRRIVEPMVSGDVFFDRLSDDYQYVVDLGLIKSIGGKIQPSNPIYAEVIARTLSYDAQEKFMLEKPNAIIPAFLQGGKIDVDRLLQEFQQFWRENSAIWVDRFTYKEAAPHLILQAFLQRVINGGGDIIREMAAGTGRTDLCLVYDGQKYPIELKIRRGDKALTQGIEQTLEYMDTFGCTQGWLVIFDRRPEVEWDDKIFVRKETVNGKTVTVLGM